MSTRYLNYIDGTWADGPGSDPNLSPADTRVELGTAVRSSTAEIALAVDAAKEAFHSWRKVPAPARGEMIARAASVMESRIDELAEALAREEGKILPEARGEVLKTINILKFTAGEGTRLNGETIPSGLPSTFAYTVRVPLGVVGLITPWNFPVAIPAWKVAPAVLSGNTVVLKPAEQTPHTAVLVTEVFEEAGLPAGVLNLVHGRGEDVGQALVEHPDVAAISFTGSNEIGHLIYREAAKTGKAVQCEMGGKNPVIVLADADLDLAAAGAAMGAFGSTGQRCTATARAIVEESVLDEFVEKVRGLAKDIRCGDPIDPDVNLGPVVDGEQHAKVLEYLQIARDEGATVKCGGGVPDDAACSNGFFVEPTILTGVTPDMRIAREEIFGPVLSVISVPDVETAIRVANDVEFGLSSSLYSNNNAAIHRYIDDIETGIVHVNSPTVGGEAQLPFGGMKATGIGPRELGRTAIDFYSEWKTVYVDYTGARREGNLY